MHDLVNPCNGQAKGCKRSNSIFLEIKNESKIKTGEWSYSETFGFCSLKCLKQWLLEK